MYLEINDEIIASLPAERLACWEKKKLPAGTTIASLQEQVKIAESELKSVIKTRQLILGTAWVLLFIMVIAIALIDPKLFFLRIVAVAVIWSILYISLGVYITNRETEVIKKKEMADSNFLQSRIKLIEALDGLYSKSAKTVDVRNRDDMLRRLEISASEVLQTEANFRQVRLDLDTPPAVVLDFAELLIHRQATFNKLWDANCDFGYGVENKEIPFAKARLKMVTK